MLFLLSLGPKRKQETTVQNQKEPFIWVNDQKEEQKALQRMKKWIVKNESLQPSSAAGCLRLKITCWGGNPILLQTRSSAECPKRQNYNPPRGTWWSWNKEKCHEYEKSPWIWEMSTQSPSPTQQVERSNIGAQCVAGVPVTSKNWNCRAP